MKGSSIESQAGEAAAIGPRKRWRWSFAWRFGLFVLGCVAFLFVGGFIIFASHVSRMSAPAEMKMADGIVVLTGGQSRIEAAVALLKAGKGKRLLISGVNPVAGMEDLRIATGADEGLFRCCVDIDHAALDTIGNAEESAKWVDENAYGTIIVVTNNYHMPRSLLEMRRYLHHAVLRPYPVINTPLDRGEWITNPDALRVMLTEYVKFVAALGRGMLPDAPGLPDGHVIAASAAQNGE